MIQPGLTKQARKEARNAFGKLSERLLPPTTRNRYAVACAEFYAWLIASFVEWPETVLAIDQACCAWIDACWEEGEAKGFVGDCLSGMHHFLPFVRGRLNGAWRLHSAWGRFELPYRCWPMPELVLLARCGLTAAWGWFDVAWVLECGFRGFLRTVEYLGLSVAAIAFGPQGLIHLSLQDTKGASRKNQDPWVQLQRWGDGKVYELRAPM